MKESPDPREALERLIEHFEQNLYAIKSPQYNETQARLEFINPLFTLLGWDMDNRQGYAEAYKDVIHEDAIKMGGYTKAPDYCFRIGGTRKFFVEAKKPSVNIKDDPEPAYQLRRYAWSAKLPLSILTDFQELAVYDCRVKPAPTDKASTGRIRYITYSDYAKEWDSLASVFSREAVLKGSFDKYVESNKAKRGTAEVDAAFLKEIEAWRDALARNLALRNPNLTTRELNFSVQVTIDRIIFLRICEDRGVEDYARLMALQNGPDVYSRLMGLFRSADERYNSGLFHFESEKGREAHDTLTPSLSVDDKVLKEILKGLYYPDSPYEFSVLPADILGQVYEQFLGKVIRLTPGHQAKVEDKPEVKKAGGVYYTPTYIVDYIVKNTVGKMLGSRVQGQGSSQEEDSTTTLNPNPFTLDPTSIQGERVRDDNQELSGVDGLAKIDGLGGDDLSHSQEVPERGDLRADRPDQESSGLHSGEHRGGIREDSQGGLSSPSLDRARLSDGSGNASRHSLATEISSPGVRKISAGPPPRGGKDARAPHSRPSKPLTLTPLPLTLRVLDPACGSGSFLLGAYQYLLTWYRDRYVEEDTQKWAKGKEARLYQAGGGEWKLTTSERKRILLNHIYGVDIDAQAVEVTKLSLLLKVLEGETKESVSIQRRLFNERALPDLSRNIKCGNSLIGSDFYKGEQIALFDEEERDRINAFDWEDEFPEVFGKLGSRVKGQGPRVKGQGSRKNQNANTLNPSPSTLDPALKGFDVVIGNPPYVRIQGFPTHQVAYFADHYRSATGNCDIYVSFVERAFSLLTGLSRLGFIVPNKFFRTDYGVGLRTLLSEQGAVSNIVDFGVSQVFPATTYTCLLFLCRGKANSFDYAKTGASCSALADLRIVQRPQKSLTSSMWTFESDEVDKLLTRMLDGTVRLLDLPAEMSRGVSTGDDDVFILDADGPDVETGILRQPLFANDFARYRYSPSRRWRIIYPYVREADGYRLYDEAELESKFPRTFAYLFSRKAVLEKRKQYQHWYGYSAPRNLALHDKATILVPLLANRGMCAKLPATMERNLCPMASGGFTVTFSARCEMNPAYVLGLLNSTLLFWCLTKKSNVFRGGWITCTKQYFGELPIKVTDLSLAVDKSRHDKMVSLVERILGLNERLPLAKTDHDKTLLQRQITATDKEIDRLVYDLYGLTDDEIAIVEGKEQPR